MANDVINIQLLQDGFKLWGMGDVLWHGSWLLRR